MRLYIGNETKNRLPGKLIRELFEIVASREAQPNWRAGINVVFIGDRRMQTLNKRHRGLSRPTDVLSFNLDRPDREDGIFGEIYISCDTARRQARQLDVDLTEEYARLACHGLMHLFGYDHKKPSEAMVMESKERECLALLGRG